MNSNVQVYPLGRIYFVSMYDEENEINKVPINIFNIVIDAYLHQCAYVTVSYVCTTVYTLIV